MASGVGFMVGAPCVCIEYGLDDRELSSDWSDDPLKGLRQSSVELVVLSQLVLVHMVCELCLHGVEQD